MFRGFRGIDPRHVTPLGILAGMEVAIRGFGNASIVDIVEVVAEGVLLTTVVGVSHGWIGETIGELVMWCLYAALIYRLLPTLFPKSVARLAEDRLLMAIMAIGVVILARPLTHALGYTRAMASSGHVVQGNGPSIVQSFFFVIFLCCFALILYFWFGRQESLLGRDTVFRRLVKEFGDGQLVRNRIDPSEKPVSYRVYHFIEILLPICLLLFVVIVLGIVVGVTSTLYPIPELLLIGTTIIVKWNAWFGGLSKFEEDGFDISLEDDLGESAFTVFKSEKGLGIGWATFFVVFSTFMMMAFAIMGLRQTVNRFSGQEEFVTGWSGTVPASIEPIAHYTILSAAVTAFLCGLSLLWGWIRVVRRSPSFVEAWEQRAADVPGVPQPPATSRPPYGMFVPMVIAVATLPGLRPGLYNAGNYEIQTILGVAYLAGIVILGVWVWQTLEIPPQPALSDDWVYGTWYLLLFVLLSVSGVASQISPLVILPIPLLFFYIHYQVDVSQALEERGYNLLSEASAGVHLLLFGAILVFYPAQTFVYAGFVAVSLLLAIGFIYKIRYRDEPTPIPDTFVQAHSRVLSTSSEPKRVLIVEPELPTQYEPVIHDAFHNCVERWETVADIQNITAIEATGTAPRPWVATPKPSGRTLADVRSDFSLRDVQTFVGNLATTMKQVRDRDVQYQAPHPENIVVTRERDDLRLRIHDWGLEQACERAVDKYSTRVYFAPELRGGADTTGESADVYHLAALTYFVITGQAPTEVELATGEDFTPEEWIPPSRYATELPRSVDDVIRSGLRANPADRPQTIREFRRHFHDAISGHLPSYDDRVSSQNSESPEDSDHSMLSSNEQSSPRSAVDWQDCITRRSALNTLGLTAYSITGYIYPTLGGANDAVIPDNIEYSIHSKMGTLQWEFDTTETVAQKPAVTPKITFISTRGGNVIALNTEDGTELWRTETEGSQVYSPTVENDIVYVGDNNSNLYALNAKTGTEEWKLNFESPAIAPVVAGDTLFAGAGNAVAVDKDDGTVKWSQPLDAPSAPTISEGQAIFGSHGGIHSFNAETGNEAWFFDTVNTARTTNIAGGTLFVVATELNSETSCLYAITADNGEEVWRFDSEQDMDPTGVAINDNVHIGVGNSAVAFDRQDGTKLWKFAADDLVRGMTACDDGTLYLSSFDEHLYAVDSARGSERWSFRGGGIMGTPAIGTTRVFVGSEINKMFAIARE